MSAVLKKIEGVESVDVSLEKASVDITLKADNTVTLAQLRRTIRSNGNETKDAHIDATGRVIDRDGKPVLDLLNGATMELETRSEKAPRGTVHVSGVSIEQTKTTERLRIIRIK